MVLTEQDRRYGAFSLGRNPLRRLDLEKIARAPRGRDDSFYPASSDKIPGDTNTARADGDAGTSPELDSELNGDGAISLSNGTEETSASEQRSTGIPRSGDILRSEPVPFHRKRFYPRNGSFR